MYMARKHRMADDPSAPPQDPSPLLPLLGASLSFLLRIAMTKKLEVELDTLIIKVCLELQEAWLEAHSVV